MPETLAQRVISAMLEEDRATAMLGMRVVDIDEGACTMEMPIRADMLNGHGTCHGGLLFSLADTTFAFACNSRNQRTVAAGAQIDFVLPAREGDVIRASASERAAGRRLGVYDVTLTNQRGETIALFRGRSCRIEGAVLPDAPKPRA